MTYGEAIEMLESGVELSNDTITEIAYVLSKEFERYRVAYSDAGSGMDRVGSYLRIARERNADAEKAGCRRFEMERNAARWRKR